MNQEFKTIIKRIKATYDLTQGQIADKLGVTPTYLSDVSGGRVPFNDKLRERIESTFPNANGYSAYQYGVESAIMDYMRSKVYTVYDMAKQLNVSPTEVTETLASGFNEDSARKWADVFGFDMNFLLTGEGCLIPAKEKYVPLIPVTAQAGHLGDFSLSVSDYDCEKIISPVKDAELAVPIRGESMAPEFPSGSIVYVKKINEKAFIEWGKAYVLDTSNGAVVKYLAPGEEGKVRCISANKDPMYAPFEIPLSEIFGIYRIVNLLCMK